jgi:hypothetical protein
MSPTSLTALIVTIRDLYAFVALIIFIVIFIINYIILRKAIAISKFLSFTIALIFSFSLSLLITEYFLGLKPLNLEIVRAG